MSTGKIDAALEITVEAADVKVVSDGQALGDAEADFEKARLSQLTVIDAVMEAVREATPLAVQSQDEKLINAMANIIRAANQANKTLMDIRRTNDQNHFHGDKRDLARGQPREVTNQNLFVGSTADLARLFDERGGRRALGKPRD